MKDKQKILLLIIALVVTIILFVGTGLTPQNMAYFLSRRLPRVLAMIVTGGAIAFSSVVFQTITHNRILTPNVLGLDSVYMFIQTLIAFVVGTASPLGVGTVTNFVMTLMAMMVMSVLFYRVLFKKENQNIMLMVLIGMVLGTFFSSLSTGMQFLMDPNEFLMLQDSMFASFNSMNTKLLGPALIFMSIAIIWVRKDIVLLDALALGRSQAMNLGVDYDKVVKKLLIVIAIMVSVSTALVGPITFLGIIVANLAREFVKTYKHSTIISTSMLMSGIFLVGGQWMIERVFGMNMMLSVVINFVGGTYFLYLLLKENRV
ncbi:MAG: iron chelate uptake ABC transporter family permease subunit [Cellulosilyticaceae bacterium]